MRRRHFLAAVGSLPALSAPAIAQRARVLRFVPDADLALLDPTWVTAYQTRDHAFMVYDTLFGQDQNYRPTLQMLESYQVEKGGLEWRMTLRQGLKFHDGERVLSKDHHPG